MTPRFRVLAGVAAGALSMLLPTRAARAQDPCTQFDPPPPPYCYTLPSVSTNGGTVGPYAPNTTGHTAVFTVSNIGETSGSITWSCAGSSNVTCTGMSSSSATLDPGTSIDVTVTFSVGSVGTGSLSLNASGSGGPASNSYSVSVALAASVAVTPDGATMATEVANTGGHSQLFTVQNTGSSQTTYTLTCSAVAPVTCGTVTPASVTLSGGASTQPSVAFSVGSPGTGTLTLTASGSGATDNGSYSVPVATMAVAVTPDGAASSSRPPNTGGYSLSFGVQNTGTMANTLTLTCTSTGPVTCGTVSPSTWSLNGGASTAVTVAYSVGAVGSGTLTLTASGSGVSDAGSYAVPVSATAFLPSSVNLTSHTLVKDAHYVLVETANAYDGAGRVTQITDARSAVTNYTYGGNTNSAFLTQVSQVHDVTGIINLVTNIAYDANGYVSSIQDPGGSFKYFTYDGFGRLRQVKNNASVAVHAYGYVYSETSPNWTFNTASPNAVIDSGFIQQTPTVGVVVSTQYIDGLGKAIQTVVQDGTNYDITPTQYDAMERPWKAWRPYQRTVAGYDASFAYDDSTWWVTYLGSSAQTTGVRPFTATSYTPDELSRVSKVVREFGAAELADSALTTYGVDATAKQEYTAVTDENGHIKRGYTDLFGNPVKSILGYGTSVASTTTFAPDILGHRLQATDPRSLNTSYTYDTRGQLTSRSSPDAGTASSKYDNGGNLRFSQDANQTAAGTVYFTNYDFAGRPLNSGLGTATFSSLDPNAAQGALETTQGNWLLVRAYDAKPPTAAFPWSTFSTQITAATLNNVSGRLAATAAKSNGSWQVTLLSYDADGQIAAKYTYTQANGGGAVWTAVNSTINYTRDLRGALTQRAFTVGSSNWYQWYDYDGRGLLTKLSVATTNSKPASADVTDLYGPSGQVSSFQFPGLIAEPVTYNIRGLTVQIGNPNTGATYPFSVGYWYLRNGLNGDQDAYNTYGAGVHRFKYLPSYDALDRMTQSDYYEAATGGGWNNPNSYDLKGITYDASGNILTLQRYRSDNTLIDNLTYTYAANSNRLTSVSDAVPTTAETWDAESGSFTYDANGNMLTAPAPYSVTGATYDPANLPLTLTRAGVTSSYRYDAAGERITKQVGSGDVQVYLLDGSTTLGVATLSSAGAFDSAYFNLVWESRVVGRQPATGSRKYYYTDILGSTRAVATGTTITEAYDPDAWGVLMAGRTLADTHGATREGFSSKEQDAETGLAYFGARYYMPELGRWSSVDPLWQNFPAWSPYNYVYDNPAGLVDPFGRSACKEARAWTECIAQKLANWGATKPGAVGTVALNAGAALNGVFAASGFNAAATAGDEIGSGQVGRGLLHATLVIGGAKVASAVLGKVLGAANKLVSSAGADEGGAIGTSLTTPIEPQTAGMSRVSLKAGTFVNRVYSSAPGEGQAQEMGRFFSPGSGLPTDAATAMSERALNPALNNAQLGAVFRVTTNITAYQGPVAGGSGTELFVPDALAQYLAPVRTGIPIVPSAH